jgi:hypothetical protein
VLVHTTLRVVVGSERSEHSIERQRRSLWPLHISLATLSGPSHFASAVSCVNAAHAWADLVVDRWTRIDEPGFAWRDTAYDVGELDPPLRKSLTAYPS